MSATSADLRMHLKQGTADLHSRIEKQSLLGELFSENFSVADYREILNRFYQLHWRFESELQNVKELQDLLPDLSERWKVPSLQKDLSHWSIPEAVEFPFSSLNLSKALGIFCVLEGSSLGGQVIHRKLSQKPGFESEAFHYYNHYREKTGQYWQTFVSSLDLACELKLVDFDECLSSARLTFETMIQHFAIETKNQNQLS